MYFLLSLNVGYIILSAIRFLTGVLCNFMYSLIAWMYQLFMTVARINILSTEQVAPIYERITMILTIVMTFYITFSLVKYAINPDMISDKEKGAGNVVTKLLIVVVLIAFVPKIFDLAYDLQRSILENQVLSKVILGAPDTDMGTLGNEFSANMLGLFYNIDKEECDKVSSNNCGKASVVIDDNLTKLRQEGSIDITNRLNTTVEKGNAALSDDEYHFAIKFDFAGVLPLIVGGVILYVLGLYSIDLGTRYVQLLFLQLIAPITIMGYLSPKKDNMFQKWVKQCITTYLDVFIRLSIIYFVLLVIKVLGDAFADDTSNIFTGVSEVTTSLKVFTYIILVIGLLIFAQKASKLLGELFPSSGAAGLGFGFTPSKEKLNALGAVRRTVGGAGGFVAGTVAGRSIRAGIEGAKTAFDNKKNTGLLGGSIFSRMKKAATTGENVFQQRQDVKNDGGTVWGYEHRAGHYKNVAQEQDRRINNWQAAAKAKDTVADSTGEIKIIKQLKQQQQAAINSGDQALALRLDKDIKNVEKAIRVYSTDRNNTANMNRLQQAIGNAAMGTALESHLGVTIAANGTASFSHVDNLADSMNEEYDAAHNTVAAKTNNDKYSIIKTNLAEARKIANAAMGSEEVNGTAVSNMTEAKFAEDIGDVQTRANELTAAEKAKGEYKRAHANAKGPGGESK